MSYDNYSKPYLELQGLNSTEIRNRNSQKSIGSNKKTKKDFKLYRGKTLLFYVCVSLIVGITIGSITTASLPKKPNIYEISSLQEMDYKQFAEMEARYTLLTNGLNVEPITKPGLFSGRAPDYDNDYEKIKDIITLEDLYGFYLVFDRSGAATSELSKLIRLLGYKDLDDFLVNSPVVIDGVAKYGFYDYSEYGRKYPDLEVWARYAAQAYQQGFESKWQEDEIGRGLS